MRQKAGRALELRDPSWYNREVYRMLQGYRATMVQPDLPKCPTPQVTVAEDFVCLRFHGPEVAYRGSYGDTFLSAHAKRIAAWVKEEREVYVYFNNTMGNAAGNLATLNKMVNQELAKR